MKRTIHQHIHLLNHWILVSPYLDLNLEGGRRRSDYRLSRLPDRVVCIDFGFGYHHFFGSSDFDRNLVRLLCEYLCQSLCDYLYHCPYDHLFSDPWFVRHTRCNLLYHEMFGLYGLPAMFSVCYVFLFDFSNISFVTNYLIVWLSVVMIIILHFGL